LAESGRDVTAESIATWHLNFIVPSPILLEASVQPVIAVMSQFRAAKLDIGCFTKIRNIRDHTKRKVYAENEPERYAITACLHAHD
jgi:hypothetical protein